MRRWWLNTWTRSSFEGAAAACGMAGPLQETIICFLQKAEPDKHSVTELMKHEVYCENADWNHFLSDVLAQGGSLQTHPVWKDLNIRKGINAVLFQQHRWIQLFEFIFLFVGVYSGSVCTM